MNWITNYVRPKINDLLNRKDMPENLWIKCPETGEMVFHKDLEANMGVIPNSGYHMRISAKERFSHFFDGGEYENITAPAVAVDPLKFRDKKRYTDRLKEARNATGQDDSVIAGEGVVGGIDMIAVAHEMDFVGGSLGMAAGEMIVTAMMKAANDKKPLVIFAASGGARMQEGILSLMQLPRTTVAVQMMREANVPYIVVLTNPTTGGVSASYAMLGDVHIAEPGAVIGFAGRRVIEQTIRENLPVDFQTSEYLQEHGMVDLVVHRHELKATIVSLVSMLTKRPAPEKPEVEEEEGLAEPVDGEGGEPVSDETAAEADTGTNGTEEAEPADSEGEPGQQSEAVDSKEAESAVEADQTKA